jgi:proline dehydrogenase
MAGFAHEHLSMGRAIHTELAARYADLGITISADLLRSEADCADLAAGSRRVRLVRQGVGRTPGLSFTGRHEIDKSYVRCMRLLLARGARPILATHDPRLIEIARALAVRHDRDTSDYWLQFRFGVHPEVAAQLVADGAHISVLVPYGPDWSAYLARHVDLRPEVIGRAARTALDR